MDNDILLMCKDMPVYNVTLGEIIDKSRLPGALLRGTLTFDEWAKTRYSTGTNATARRLMLRAFGSDNHKSAQRATRGLSLTDCYWFKERSETVLFGNVSPYFRKEWDGNGRFEGGSIATVFTNGAADKIWLDKDYLLKKGAFAEKEAYEFCVAVGLTNIAKTKKDEQGLIIENFTSPAVFFESMEQSGYVTGEQSPQAVAVDKFGLEAALMFAADYIIENDDRHWGNYGFLRNADTGRCLGIAPAFDFDWAWSGGVALLPENALNYASQIQELCQRALDSARLFPDRENVILNRAAEIIKQL